MKEKFWETSGENFLLNQKRKIEKFQVPLAIYWPSVSRPVYRVNSHSLALLEGAHFLRINFKRIWQAQT